jgi:RNA polymerase sigma factor (sigma-70 family)
MTRQMECDSFSDEQLIELIAEDTDYLKCVSHKTRSYCIRFMQRLADGIDPDQLEDIYHDALLVLYEKAKGGQFRLTCSIQTYLNSICRNQLLSLRKSAARLSPLSDGNDRDMSDDRLNYDESITDWLHTGDSGINADRVQAIVASLEQMKGKGDCHELLLLVHYQGKSMKEVAEHFNYKNEQIARNKNYLCREKLKALTLQILKKLKL